MMRDDHFESTTMDETNMIEYDDEIEAMREQQYPMIKDAIYLDHAGTTPYAKALIDRFSSQMLDGLYGNPHSASSSSQETTQGIEMIRHDILDFFNADPNYFDVVFVANATAGIKLVAESLSALDRSFWYGYHEDSHTSLVGVREVAQTHQCFHSDDDVETWLSGLDVPLSPFLVPSSDHASDAGSSSSSEASNSARDSQRSTATSSYDSISSSCRAQATTQEPVIELFAYPAQSNMNGRRLPLAWCRRIRQSSSDAHIRRFSLLDAAAYVSTSPLDLSNSESAPDFTVLSFYKIFGFPDLGALIVRKDASDVLLHRKYFGGGTVDMVLCQKEQWHAKKTGSLHATLEDGTLPIHSILALKPAMDVHKELFGSMTHISKHVSRLSSMLYRSLCSLRHANGQPVCQLYHDAIATHHERRAQGPIVAFNLRNSHGEWISTTEVQKLAAIENVHIRNGGLCNPGGIAAALGLAAWEMRENFSAGHRCGGENDIVNGKPTGMLRASLGAMSTKRDVDRFISFIDEFFVELRALAPPLTTTDHTLQASAHAINFTISAMTVYPIKSCAGVSVPRDTPWPIKSAGLAWDREWCLLHRGTGEVLNQKRHPRMALLKPTLDFGRGVLRISYQPRPPSPPSRHPVKHEVSGKEITIPLSADPACFVTQRAHASSLGSSSCSSPIDQAPRIYASASISTFFSTILEVPCQLARMPSSSSLTSSTSTRSPQSHANESPILAISTASLAHLNQRLTAKEPNLPTMEPGAFRANIVLTPVSASNHIESAYAEDTLSTLNLVTSARTSSKSAATARLAIKGPCKRCQMINVDQQSGEKREGGQPFVTLAKERRRAGGVWFGVHCALDHAAGDGGGGVQGMERGGGGAQGMGRGEGDDGARTGEVRVSVGDVLVGGR